MGTTKAAFQTWMNGYQLQYSSLYLNDDAQELEKEHWDSNTFASLHVFDSVEEGEKAYESMVKEAENY